MGIETIAATVAMAAASGSKLTNLSARALHCATQYQASLCRSSIPSVYALQSPRVSAKSRHGQRWNSSFAPRVGKAVEPQSTNEPPPPSADQAKASPEQPSREVIETEDQGTFESSTVEDLKRAHAESLLSRASPTGPPTDGSGSGSDGQETGGKSPLDEVLAKEPPRRGPRAHPSMSPPPYVHHFDSYSMVKQLQQGGYTDTQAIEAMKGIRALLAQNLDVAQESLVSKSDVENVSTLVRRPFSPALHMRASKRAREGRIWTDANGRTGKLLVPGGVLRAAAGNQE